MTTKQKNKSSTGHSAKYSRELPLYDTMEQCSGATGVPISDLRKAKAKGCLAFVGGRVHFAEFIQFWFEHPELFSSRQRRLMEQATAGETGETPEERPAPDELRGGDVFEHLLGELEKLAQELPASLKGKTEGEIQAECESRAKLMRGYLELALEAWNSEKSKASR